MKRILVDMSATLLHHGHIRLLEQAAQMGRVIVALTSDAHVIAQKGFVPELDFAQRQEMLLALRHVDEVIERPWPITEAVLRDLDIDLLLHGDDNLNPVPPAMLKIVPRTEGISSTLLRWRALENLALLSQPASPFSAGAMHPLALRSLYAGETDPASGAGAQPEVARQLMALSGHTMLACLYGTPAQALQTAITAAVSGRVLVIGNGPCAETLAKQCQAVKSGITRLDRIDTPGDTPPLADYDWCLAAYTDPLLARKLDMGALHALARRLGARLLVDASSSIGLEEAHTQADLLVYGSDGGLFGLPGLAFVAHREPCEGLARHHADIPLPSPVWHTLAASLPHLSQYREAVSRSKALFMQRFGELALYPPHEQPLLCTRLSQPLVYTPTGHQSTNVYHLAAACLPEIRQQVYYDFLERS